MSHRIAAKITGVAGCVPPKILSNADLEKMVATNDEWIRTRTDIRERHIAEKGTPTSHLAVQAAQTLLAQTKTDPTEIDLIVLATVTPDMMFPATACLVQDKLGATKAWGFDLQAGCSQFVYALQVGAQFVQTGAHKKVMVIGADVMSSIIDYTDRATCVLFGDGAGAVIVEPVTEDDGDVGLLDFMHEVDGSGGCSLYMPGGGSLNPSSHETVDKKMHFVHQDGAAVFKFAVRKMSEACVDILKRNHLTGDDIDLMIPHQANLRIINATAERLKLPPEKVVINIERYGNTTGATIPLAMHSAIEEGRLKKGDLVLLAAVGAGFTVGTTLLRWAL